MHKNKMLYGLILSVILLFTTLGTNSEAYSLNHIEKVIECSQGLKWWVSSSYDPGTNTVTVTCEHGGNDDCAVPKSSPEDQ